MFQAQPGFADRRKSLDLPCAITTCNTGQPRSVQSVAHSYDYMTVGDETCFHLRLLDVTGCRKAACKHEPPPASSLLRYALRDHLTRAQGQQNL
eukprot:6255403-Amphidinium_carterae.1